MTSKQRAILKSEAHHIKPTFQIGVASLHENIIKALDTAFNNKEIIKIKVNRLDQEDKTEVKRIADAICQQIDVELVGVIGTTIILYRQHSDPDLRIEL